jgi:hypothetical protein
MASEMSWLSCGVYIDAVLLEILITKHLSFFCCDRDAVAVRCHLRYVIDTVVIWYAWRSILRSILAYLRHGGWRLAAEA